MKKINIEELKVGQWLEANFGIFEVVEAYDDLHGWVTVQEVEFEDDFGEKYSLGDESHITKSDLSMYELI